MKIAFIKNNVIVNIAEFDSEPIDMSIFLQDNDADSYILEGSEILPEKNLGIGSYLDTDHGVYLKAKPFASWVLDESYSWVAPTPRPDIGYFWEEESQSWKLAE